MTDQVIPINSLDPNTDTIPETDSERGFRVWNRPEVYTGPKGKGKYVPNVDDAVLDWDNGLYRVIEVDYTTGLSRLEKKIWPRDPTGDSDYDIILGAGPGLFQSESQRIYINKGVIPFTLDVDRQLFTYGQDVRYCKIFRGYEIGEAGKIIGIYYTANGNDANENIPLMLVATNDMTNLSIKTPMQAFTTANLEEGEPCTVVFYGDQNNVLSKAVLFTSVTTFTRPTEMGQQVITGIELISPHLAKNDNTVIEVPLNMTIESLMMLCRIHYNDGYRDVAIDGTKVKLTGTDQYVATIEGERIPLVLLYYLGPDEASLVGSENTQRFIPKNYSARTRAVEGAYSVKLFPVPVWVDEFTGWELEWYMYNMDRQQAYYVTPYIEAMPNTAPFKPLKYGVQQDIGVSIEISKVDSRLNPHRHSQTLGITLMGNGVTTETPWLIQYSKNSESYYGKNLAAKFTFNAVGNWSLDLSSGFTSLDLWLDAVYYTTQPLYIEGSELKAPKPTHFVLVLNDIVTEYPIAQWNKVLTVRTGMNAGESVVLKFIQRLGNTDLQLSASPLVVQHTNVTKTS